MHRDVRILQTCYPQIYLACHTRHARRRSGSSGISATDSTLLAHLDEPEPTRPGALARHLGIGRRRVAIGGIELLARAARQMNGRSVVGFVAASS